MSSKIVVSEVDARFEGLVSARLRYGETDDVIWFQLPISHRPHPDLIASAIAAVFGSTFNKWEYRGPVSTSTLRHLESFTGAEWDAPLYSIDPRSPGKATVLNFSGGFDSLAALALLGEDKPKVSIDFGPRFERERDFFSKFDTAIVSTNARSFEKSWTFMGVGAILLADYFDAGYLSFGSILEASPWGMVARETPKLGNPLFYNIGLRETNPLGGMTEFGTALIAARAFPGLIEESLSSLADRHTEKYKRKFLLLQCVAEKFEEVDAPNKAPAPTLKEPIRFGSHFAADFLAPGMWMHCNGTDWMRRPEGFDNWAEGKDLEFYWREIPSLDPHPLASLEQTIASRKAAFGVQPYRAVDWDEIRNILNVVSFFHAIPGKVW